jgi:hypothetical protein
VHTSMDGIHLAIVEQDHGTVINCLPSDKSAAQLETKLGSPMIARKVMGSVGPSQIWFGVYMMIDRR